MYARMSPCRDWKDTHDDVSDTLEILALSECGTCRQQRLKQHGAPKNSGTLLRGSHLFDPSERSVAVSCRKKAFPFADMKVCPPAYSDRCAPAAGVKRGHYASWVQITESTASGP